MKSVFNKPTLKTNVSLYMEELEVEEPVAKRKGKSLTKDVQQVKDIQYYNGYALKSYVGDGGSDYYAWKKRALVLEGEYVRFNGQIILA